MLGKHPINSKTLMLKKQESVEELKDENDEEIKFDLDGISIELRREPAVKCEVINVTGIIKKMYSGRRNEKGITIDHDSLYEPRMSRNYKIKSVYNYKLHLSKEISTYLREATCNNFTGEDVFMNGGKTRLSRDVAYSFNDLSTNLS
ncbi:hypothetical protein RclHR1_11430003 [Rhizophagus clarus]|uniref:Uncharacterized protein n=1 Tax=Rhizophagus clarus TaxID=94130 RepID=A0A2Z6Q5P7_9GLOM|nr:hypothetical protein RclHR1_11430003 [Rhizophagus clarus]